jgi:hypothetical protein
MVVGAMPHEKATCIAERFDGFRHGGYLGKIERVREFEAQQALVKTQTFGHFNCVKAKMSQTPNFEWTWQEYAPNVVKLRCNSHGWILPDQ